MPVPEFNFEPKVRVENGHRQIFDPVRKGWFVLTPEEFVRQYYIEFMNKHLGYPISWMRCEVEVKGEGRKKRADLIVYDRSGNPAIICEFKAMDVPLSEETVFQAARYNRDLGARSVFIANGKDQRLIKLDLELGNHKVDHDLPPKTDLE